MSKRSGAEEMFSMVEKYESCELTRMEICMIHELEEAAY